MSIIFLAWAILLALDFSAHADAFALTQPVDHGIQIELVEPQDEGTLAQWLAGRQTRTIMGKIHAPNDIVAATLNGVSVSLRPFKQGSGATFSATVAAVDRFEFVVMDSEGNRASLLVTRAADVTELVGESTGRRPRGRTAGATHIGLGSGVIVGGGAQGYIGFVDFGYNNLVGQVLPDDAGGWWHGLSIEPRAQLGYARLEKREVCEPIAGTTYARCSGGYMYDAFDWQAGLTLGYQLLRFGQRNDARSEQLGWGVRLGAFSGAVGRGSGVATFAVAPVMRLIRSICQDRSDMRSLSVNVMVLPQKTTTLFVGAGLGF